MNYILILQLGILSFHFIGGQSKTSKEVHRGHRKRYHKSSVSITGDKREIRIGFRVCGKTDALEKASNTTSNGGANVDINALFKDIKEHSVKREWSKNWFDKLNDCCRTHDSCAQVVPPRSERHGYVNALDYKVYDCDCDDDFSTCLNEANSFAADAVGDLYFNVLHIPCLKFDKKGPLQSEHTDIVIQKVKGHEEDQSVHDMTKPVAVFHVYHGESKTPSEGKVIYSPTKESTVSQFVGKQLPDEAIVEKIPIKQEEQVPEKEEVQSPDLEKLITEQVGAKVTLKTSKEGKENAAVDTHDEKLTAVGEKVMKPKLEEVALIPLDTSADDKAEKERVGLIPVVQNIHVNPEEEKVFLETDTKPKQAKPSPGPELDLPFPDGEHTVAGPPVSSPLLDKSDMNSNLEKVEREPVPLKRNAKHYTRSTPGSDN